MVIGALVIILFINVINTTTFNANNLTTTFNEIDPDIASDASIFSLTFLFSYGINTRPSGYLTFYRKWNDELDFHSKKEINLNAISSNSITIPLKYVHWNNVI